MLDSTQSKAKPRRLTEHPPFELIALLLQGGGALGSYQAGVYQALAEANLHPEWVAGISIGAVNSALIAGNPPETRVEKLREFWEAVSTPPLGVPYLKSIELADEFTRRFVNQTRALGILLFGAPHFFHPPHTITLVLAFPQRRFRERLGVSVAPLALVDSSHVVERLRDVAMVGDRAPSP